MPGDQPGDQVGAGIAEVLGAGRRRSESGDEGPGHRGIGQRVRGLVRDALVCAGVALLAPLWLPACVERRLRLGEGWFCSPRELLSLVPGKPGIFVRRSFYRMTLDRCATDCHIGFGTTLAHPQVEIGPGVMIGNRCTVGKVTIGRDATIGSNVDILSGRRQHHFGRAESADPGPGRRVYARPHRAQLLDRQQRVVMADVGAALRDRRRRVVVKPIPRAVPSPSAIRPAVKRPGASRGHAMIYLLIGYVYLCIHRPFEIWPALGDLRVELIYFTGMSVCLAGRQASVSAGTRSCSPILGMGAAFFLSWVMSPWAERAEQVVKNYTLVVVFALMIATSVRDDAGLNALVLAFMVVMALYMLHSVWEYKNGRHTYRMGIARLVGVDTTLGDPNSLRRVDRLLAAVPDVISGTRWRGGWRRWACDRLLAARGRLRAADRVALVARSASSSGAC